MNRQIAHDLRRANDAFTKVVLPYVMPYMGGGLYLSCEDVCADGFVKMLDTHGGIDGWQILENAMRGVAVRVQWGNNWDTFTIRYSRANGLPTEYYKRTLALTNDMLYPYWTIQAFLTSDNEFLSAGLIRTKNLYWYIMYHPQHVQMRQVAGGQATMLVVDWSHLQELGLMAVITKDDICQNL